MCWRRTTGVFDSSNTFISGEEPSEGVLVQPEMESCRFLLDTFRPWGGDFQGMGVYRSDEVWRKVWGGVWSVARAPRPHRRDEPTGLSLGTVASQQSRLPFHPAG